MADPTEGAYDASSDPLIGGEEDPSQPSSPLGEPIPILLAVRLDSREPPRVL